MNRAKTFTSGSVTKVWRHYLDAKKSGRGILVATAHFGNWELSAFAHALMTEPMHVMIRPLDNPAHRPAGGRPPPAFGQSSDRRNGTRRARVLRALAAKRSRRHSDRSEHVARGRRLRRISSALPLAPTPLSPKSPLATGAAVIPGFAVWSDKERRYILRFLSSARDVRRYRRGHPAPPCQARRGHPRASRPVAVDSSPLENPSARPAAAVLKKTSRNCTEPAGIVIHLVL